MSEALIECKDYAVDVLERFLTTPLVASACSSMFPVFIEAFLQILLTYGIEYKVTLLQKIFSHIELQLTNMEKLLGTTDFDSVSDVETTVKKCLDLHLAEIETDPERNQIVNDLREQDQASVVFGKIAFYSEIIQKCELDAKAKLLKACPNFHAVMGKLFKL